MFQEPAIISGVSGFSFDCPLLRSIRLDDFHIIFHYFFFTVTEPATQTVGLSSVLLPTAVCDPVCHRRWFRSGPDVAQIFLSAFH